MRNMIATIVFPFLASGAEVASFAVALVGLVLAEVNGLPIAQQIAAALGGFALGMLITTGINVGGRPLCDRTGQAADALANWAGWEYED